MKKITAVIPVRKGSQRVIGKNLRQFGDSTLLELKINTLKKVELIDSIIVNTDSEEAIEIAKSLGVDYHRRDDFYASSIVTGSDFFEHLGKVTDTKYFAYCPCTSPFISEETIIKVIRTFLDNEDVDCVTTVSKVKEFLWLDGKALNYDPRNAPNSQDLPNIQALNFGFTIVNRETLISNKNIIGNNPIFIETDDVEGIDIDTPLDFFIAEKIYMLKTENKLNLI